MRYIIGLFVTATIVFLLGSLRVGAEIQNYESALWVALVLSVLNIVVRPILTLISLPITFMTLGLFLLVINAEATLQSVGLTIGNITYVDDIGKDMVLELQHNGKPVLPGEKLVKTSRIDLICGNGLENKENDSIPSEIPIEELIGE